MRIAGKLVLARLPIPYRFWQAISIFRHGSMDDAEYAVAVWARHWRASAMEGKKGAVVVELGPGDSLLTALAAHAHDVERCWLVDTAQFARMDATPYRAMAKLLRARGLPTPVDQDLDDVQRMLEICRTTYLSEGIHSLETLPAASVDLVWSQAMLEHVRRTEVPRLLSEMRRILRTDGRASHVVDLTDHMGGGLNQLRFSSRFWENDRIASSGFYTNRISHAEWLREFEAAGFAIVAEHPIRFDRLPISQRKLARPFCELPPEELAVSSFDVVLAPR